MELPQVGTSRWPRSTGVAAILIALVAIVCGTASVANATEGDLYAAGTTYRAGTYPTHGASTWFGPMRDDWVVDINADAGDMGRAILAPEDGSVIVNSSGANGSALVITWVSANGSEKICVGHLKDITKTGAVSSGDVIGHAGASGLSDPTADHMHVVRQVNGAPAPLVLSGQTIVPAMSPWDYGSNGTQYTSRGPVSSPGGTKRTRNLLSNASFEHSTSGWNRINNGGNVNYVAYPNNAARSHDGSGFMEMNTSVSSGSVYQDVAVATNPGDSNTFSVWLRSPNGNPISGAVQLWGLGGTNEGNGQGFTVGSQWTLVSVPLDVTAAHTALRAQIVMSTPGAQYDADGATFAPLLADAPVATIDLVSPNPAVAGQSVALAGHGTDSLGHALSAYQWRSSRDGVLSTSASFSTTALSVGTHAIYLKARCASGQWSSEEQISVVVGPATNGTAPAQTTTVLSCESNPSLGYGSTFAITGTLRSGTGLVGQRVILQSRVPGAVYKDTSLAATTTVGGVFSFAAKPKTKTYYRVRFAGSTGYLASGPTSSVCATPRAYVRTPIAPSTMRHTRYYAVYGYLKPKHMAGTYPVRIYRWKKTSSGRWKSYGYVKAKASNYSSYTKYSKKLRLTKTGKWRLRAYAPADSRHAATWSSSYDYVTVK